MNSDWLDEAIQLLAVEDQQTSPMIAEVEVHLFVAMFQMLVPASPMVYPQCLAVPSRSMIQHHSVIPDLLL